MNSKKIIIFFFFSIFFVLTSNAQTLDTNAVKKELTKKYKKIVKGFKKNNPNVWLSYLTDSFHLKLFNGAIMDRKWVTNYVTNNAKTFNIKKLSMTIEQITTAGVDDTLLVRQISERTFLDSQNNVHKLDVGAIQKEVWIKIDNSWKLKFVQEYQVLYVKRDED
jgi:hypothetical protein